jgi:hypothetical protein
LLQRRHVRGLLFEHHIGSAEGGKMGVKDSCTDPTRRAYHLAQFPEFLLDLAGLAGDGMKEKTRYVHYEFLQPSPDLNLSLDAPLDDRQPLPTYRMCHQKRSRAR